MRLDSPVKKMISDFLKEKGKKVEEMESKYSGFRVLEMFVVIVSL